MGIYFVRKNECERKVDRRRSRHKQQSIKGRAGAADSHQMVSNITSSPREGDPVRTLTDSLSTFPIIIIIIVWSEFTSALPFSNIIMFKK